MIQEVRQAFLADPSGPSALLAAATWVQNTLLGTIATVIAVIAVATIGLLMLTGRVDVRRGLVVVLGCFVLFGAHTIVQSVRGTGGDHQVALAPNADLPAPAAIEIPATDNVAQYDPYAGASVRR